ncbi:phosphotransferase family protein [Mycobacterium simiae]|uniref:phosphotransferase family protein n=1 Tax=Mycobacterium simiae TaxID=1784 RepID=UPI00262EC2DF|nr:phosphotransferase family protein [Mycobacterium simiae]
MSISDQLTDWLSDELATTVKVENLRRTTVGFSRENWLFDAIWDGTVHRLIARRDPSGSVLSTDRRIECAVLEALRHTDVPAPALRWADPDGNRLGRPALIMDLSPGRCDGFVLNGNAPLTERLTIAHRIYDRLADIHRVDWRAIGLGRHLANPGNQAAAAALDHWEAELDKIKFEPEPELAFVLSWLRDTVPGNEAVTLVHGDFKPGNVLLEDGDVTAVLDWETAHLGDPHEDLGWITNPLRAYEHTIAGSWEPNDVLQRWSEQTGIVVNLERVQWWRVLANVKLMVIVLTGHHSFLQQRSDRVFPNPVPMFAVLLDQIGA